MRKLFLIAVVLTALLGCTDNLELVENETIINTQSINKEDVTNPNNNGGEEPDNEEG